MQPTYKGVIIHLLSTMDIPVYRVCIGFVICPLQFFFITKKSPFENARNDGFLHLFLVMFIQGGPPTIVINGVIINSFK